MILFRSTPDSVPFRCVWLLYNVVGLSYAMTAHLSPIISAILMPLSSTTMGLIAAVGIR